MFFAGFVYLLVRRRIPRRLIPQLITLFVLGGLQEALGGYMVTVVLVVMLWWRSREFGERIGRRANWMVAAVIVQAGPGMATLLLHVPIWLATLHQIGAMILVTAAVLHARSVIGTRKGNPAVSEQMAR